MHVGLVTPPGALGDFVARAVEPAGHALSVAPSVHALYEQAETKPDVVLFAPVVEDRPAHEALSRAREEGLVVERPLYLGLLPEDCTRMQREGFARCLALPFQARDLLEALESSARGKLRVLLVDDSALIHRHTVPLLSAAGYEVSEAWDGAEALEKLKTERADLVLTDVEMPRLDGYALCLALKNDPATEGMPVIICSALGEATDLERGFDVGADDYLVKPVIAEELTTRVRQLLQGSMPASRERILVVDDSPAQRHYVQDCLARQAFETTTAENGRIGLEKAHTHHPALVVSDYDMPEMTGFEMVLALKRDPLTRDTPVIML